MRLGYSGSVPAHHPTLPLVWLLSDARNDAALERALAGLPRGSGFVFRHYHLAESERVRRFAELRALAKDRHHIVILSGDGVLAAEWGADGTYGPPRLREDDGKLHFATAHDGEEIQRARRMGADGIFLSPVFPTASHPGVRTLGVHGFHVLAMQSPVPVIALGGMNAERAVELDWPRWGAIAAFGSPPAA